MGQIDVLSVGDVVTDAFIKLLNDRAEAYDTEHGPVLAMPFATKIPFDHAEILPAVGNAANAAVNFAKLGLKSGLASNVGGDSAGRDIIHALQKAKVDSRFVHINPDKASNYHYVLWYKNERTILIKHEGTYSTLYGHMSKYAANLKVGAHVQQGQLIGYVGSSGLATGPHLHFEFRINGVHRNPLTVALPNGKSITHAYRTKFHNEVKKLLAKLDAHRNANRG